MRPVIQTCIPREEVMQGDLEDALFAADFGFVVEGRARSVYQDPTTFFRNTHPASELVKVMQAVFGRLNNPSHPGAVLRLSTGFGGGKTHTLIALWHLARNIGDPAMGAELVTAAMRPASVRVVGVDGEKLGYTVARSHPDASPRSLWGELAYQMGGKALLADFQQCDDPEASPTADLLRRMLDCGEPVLILLDELVKYMVKLPERASKNVVAFVGMLTAEIGARPQSVLVITDPAAQAAYAEEAEALAATRELDAARRLDDELGRRSADFDPIGNESARVIARRLFDRVDPSAADEAAKEYLAAYRRILGAYPDALPTNAATEAYADRIKQCYPFHPRLVDTAQDRLGALPAFNKSRGTLRLFARILRQIWETGDEVPLITAGDVDVTADRIQSDLLQRLNRDQFRAAVSADCETHAAKLDEEHGGDFHRRVARALLIESLPMNVNAAMDRRDIALATLRPAEVGYEPGEALDRLLSVGWHTYPDDTGARYQFRVEANVNKRIEEAADTVPLADARSDVLTRVQKHYTGATFKLNAFPSSPRAVPDSAELKLVLSDSLAMAERVCSYVDDTDTAAPERRRFRNAILALASTEQGLNEAVRIARRLKAAQQIEEEARRATEPDKLLIQQLEKLLPNLRKQANIRACRAFTRVVFHSRATLTLDERYLVPEDSAISDVKGQESLKRFLDDKELIYQPSQNVDLDILCNELLKGATPSLEHDGAFTASSLHERALESPRLRLMRDVAPVRNAVIKAVEEGRLVVRLPSGECYDKDGMVGGPEDARTRTGRSLRTLDMKSDVLIAPSDAACVAAWFAVQEPAPGDAPVPPPPPPPSPIATDWSTALEYARTRPLKRLTLRASTPQAGSKLTRLAQPFGAQSLTLTVQTSGDLKDGGTVLLTIDNAKPTSSARPIATAEGLLRSMAEDAAYEAKLAMDFGEAGADQAEARLATASEQAGADIEPVAEFGEEEG